MIVGQQKPFEEIWEMVKGFKKILVYGCNTCVAICHAGGGKEAELLATMIRMKAVQEGVDMQVDNEAIERHCEPEFFVPLDEKVKGYDLVLSTACGVGVNFLADRLAGTIPVYPGINTSFYGGVPEAGFFVELCGGCGNCSKSLMNGPCGGTDKGKCEVSSETDCAWYLIVERMKKLGTLEKLFEVQPPRDWSTGTHGGPRRVSLEHIRAYEVEEEKKATLTGEGK
jgi:ferredoxin